jgi:hypothetical protein
MSGRCLWGGGYILLVFLILLRITVELPYVITSLHVLATVTCFIVSVSIVISASICFPPLHHEFHCHPMRYANNITLVASVVSDAVCCVEGEGFDI